MPDHGCEWILDRLDAFVAGELAPGERDAVGAHCAGCARCARELDLARRIHDALRALPPLDAPSRVVDAAQRAIGAAPAAKVVPLPRRRAGRSWRMAAAAAAVTLIGMSVWMGVREHAARERERVRRATAEVALAFGYVDHYSDRAVGLVRDDVFGKRVLPRIERALEVSPGVRDDRKRPVRESGRDVTSPPPDRS